MKKLIITLILAAPLFTGCTMIDTNVTINNDNSATVAASLTYEGNIADEDDLTAETIAQNYAKFLDADYDIKTAFQDKLSTITATKTVKNLKKSNLDLSSLGFKTNLPDNKFIEVKHNMFITSYNIDCVYDAKDVKSKIDFIKEHKAPPKKHVLEPEYYQKYGDIAEMEPPADSEGDIAANLDSDTRQMVNETVQELASQDEDKKSQDFKASFSVQVPSFASYNNADNVKGNAYYWNIKTDEPTEIKLQYVRYSGFAIGVTLVLGVALLILLAVKIKMHDTQKRMDNNNNIV